MCRDFVLESEVHSLDVHVQYVLNSQSLPLSEYLS